MTFQSDITENAGTFEAILSGRLDSATSSGFEKTLQSVFSRDGVKALMDFTALDYVSSAGLRVVLMAAKRAKQAQGQLVLCGLQPHVKSVFEISGFLKILTVVEDRATALSLLQA